MIEEEGETSIAKRMKGDNEQPNTLKDNNNKQQSYKAGDSGPFILFAEGSRSEEQLNEVGFARMLEKNSLLSNQVESIKSVTRNKIKIKCETFESANKLIKSAAKLGVKIYIPESHLYSTGVISYIPLDVNEQELMANLQGPKIQKVERITRWNREKQTTEPTGAVRITFRQYMLPDVVHLYRVCFRVKHYIPKPLFCKLCKSFGHTKNHCRNPTTCQKCFKVHTHPECLEPQQKCRYCLNANHFTGSRECKETIIQNEIKKIMTIQRKTYKEAAELLTRKTGVSEVPPNLNNPWDFPQIQQKRSVNSRIIDSQNTDSFKNKFEQLLRDNHTYKLLTEEIIRLLDKENPLNPITAEIKKTVMALQSPMGRNTLDPKKNDSNAMET